MKIALTIALLASSTPVLAQTLPLSQSATFQLKANSASPSFTGTASFAGPVNLAGQINIATSTTSQFYMNSGSNGSYINFAPNTLFEFNPNTLQFEFYVSTLSSPKFGIGASAASLSVPMTLPALNISGGTQFGLGMNSGRPFIMFDGQYSRLEFDGTGNYVFWQGNRKVARIDGSGNLYTRGSVSQNLGSNCC